jgi:hypothetical protein
VYVTLAESIGPAWMRSGVVAEEKFMDWETQYWELKLSM